MSRVLIIGGAGFIGSVMARYLLQGTHGSGNLEVRLLDLQLSPVEEAERLQGSILDINDLSRAVEGCDYVVHLAAMVGVRKTDTRRLECLNVNILGTLNILNACVQDGIKKVVFASSSEVYGEQAEMPISERNSLSPKSVYAVTKLAGEEYLRAYKMRYGLDYSIVRFFNVYGPQQTTDFVIPHFIHAVEEDRPPIVYGTGEQIRAFCYVDDAVAGAAAALFNGEANSEIFNIGDDRQPITIAELARKIIAISEKSHIQPKLVPMSEADRDDSRDIRRRIPDIAKARRVLGYEPKVSLEEGIKRIMNERAYIPV